jgi:hypothetical protein
MTTVEQFCRTGTAYGIQMLPDLLHGADPIEIQSVEKTLTE